MVIEVDGVTKIYKKNRGVIDVSFNINEGEVFGLLGPNGSGKTTLMKIATGLLRAQKGSVKIFGHDVYEETEKALFYVGSIIEAPATLNFMTASDNLKAVADFYESTLDVNEVLDMVGLSKVKKDKVSKFSLGMKQRMGLALALIGNPKILILDEPTNGLDIEGTVEIRNIITDLAKQKKATILISSHLSAELQQMCTRVGVMQDARLLEIEDMNYVLENFSSLENYFLDTVRKAKGVAN